MSSYVRIIWHTKISVILRPVTTGSARPVELNDGQYVPYKIGAIK